MELTHGVKLFPQILFQAVRHDRPVTAFKVWFLAKDFNPSGNGFIPAKTFRQHLASLGIPRQTLMRWIDQALALGLLQRVEQGNADGSGLYRITSWQAGAAMVGLQRLMPPVLVEREALLKKGWLAFCWAAFLLRFDGLISRRTLEVLSGVPPRTQVAYEHKSGVINRANYASYGKLMDDPDTATGMLPEAFDFVDKPGHYFKNGELRRRLPNSRNCLGIKEISLSERGRIKAINRALELVDSSPELSSKHTLPSQFEFDLEPIRLYCITAKHKKQALRLHRLWQGDPRKRVKYQYEFCRKHARKGIFKAVRI